MGDQLIKMPPQKPLHKTQPQQSNTSKLRLHHHK